MRKGDIVFYLMCLVAATMMFYLVKHRISQPDYQPKLSLRDSRGIIEQIGVESFEKLKAYHCETPIAIYIHTNKWTDNWCHNKYKHLNFHFTDKGDNE
jgi:hypothetical protein